MSEPTFLEPAPVPSTRPDRSAVTAPAPGVATPDARAAGDELLAPGTVIARFIVHRALGAGSAGVVYAVHDPELDRTIALKVLRREVAERGAARLRFLREAQALARLSHPNVISVYDVGAARGHTFIAMEYIHGRTFADWIAAAPRAWSEIVAVLVKAGRGLAAAHAAGLIHRDFKPANLLVGDDGRVVVTDFGLARAVEAVSDEAEPEAPSGWPSGGTLATAITRTGAVQGTPAYMAPEQADGDAADARADQFSFCVTLYEALFGVHPFLSRHSPSLASTRTTAAATSGGDPGRAPGATRIPSDDRGVPAWLQRAVLRGLCERPEDRHPSMDSLLAVLNHEPVRRRRRMQLAVGSAAVALLAVWIAAYAIQRDPSVALCAGAADRLAGIWTPGARAEMRSAFDATGLSYAADTWRRVEPILDSYVAQWAAMHTDACRATRVHGEQSELLMDRRMACLDVRRRELDQLTRLLRKPDADIVEHAIGAARGLGSIQSCGDLAALTRSIAPPPDPGTAARVTAARHKLAEARVLRDAGKYTEGLALVDQLVDEPVTRDYLPLRAEIAHTAGRLRAARTEWARAATHLDDAIWAAEASGHDEIAVVALSDAAVVLSELDRFKDANDMIRRGEAALLRMAAPPLARIEFRTSVCHTFDREGRFAEARAACQQALDLRRRELGPDHPEVAMSLYRLGRQAGNDEHSDSDQQGLDYFREALAIEERALGPDHPEVERTLTAMSSTELRLGRLDAALEHARRALTIAERAFGPDSMRVFSALSGLGNVRRYRGENAEAAAAFRRALAIVEHGVGPEHSQAALAHIYLGDVLQAETDYASALQQYRRAAAIYEATVGTAHPNHAIVVLDICSMEFELKRWREALADCTRGLDRLEQAVGRSAPAVADALVGMIDRVYAGNGRVRDAFVALDHGIAIWRKEDPTAPVKIADGELRLAQTIWDSSPLDRPRARALAVRARDRLVAGGPGFDAKRAEIEAWLGSHRVPDRVAIHPPSPGTAPAGVATAPPRPR